jgi:hypothetical protein
VKDGCIVALQQLSDLMPSNLALLRCTDQVANDPVRLKRDDVYRHFARTTLDIRRVQRDGEYRDPVEVEGPLPVRMTILMFGPRLRDPRRHARREGPSMRMLLGSARLLASRKKKR